MEIVWNRANPLKKVPARVNANQHRTLRPYVGSFQLLLFYSIAILRYLQLVIKPIQYKIL